MACALLLLLLVVVVVSSMPGLVVCRITFVMPSQPTAFFHPFVVSFILHGIAISNLSPSFQCVILVTSCQSAICCTHPNTWVY